MGGWWIYFFRRIEWHSLGKDKTRARQADLGLRTRRLGPMLSARRWSQCRYDWRLESEYIKVMRRILTDYINRIHEGKNDCLPCDNRIWDSNLNRQNARLPGRLGSNCWPRLAQQHWDDRREEIQWADKTRARRTCSKQTKLPSSGSVYKEIK